ncbi:unnamed protein product [Pieris macdunnoughi]|uniref:PPM-type phosphatase domain-containing protein n=1 Tax=Pieris macdunnoughi TaxID=345717 RepID=A0A821X8G9_9NEOP|nr:unnamed protein product [Pieris macdunnoughi]
MTPLLRIILDEVRIAAKKYPNDFGYNADKSAYKAISLMQAVIAKVNAVCMRYLDNSRLDTLPPPPRTQKEFLTVSAALRNSRRVMEDRHVEIGNLEALFDIEDERKRIEASGGTVMYWGTWRVNGQLAVSRAIGDAQYKPYVIAHPEQAALDLDGDEDFLVIACDGLWDVVSEDEVALAVYRQITADPKQGARSSPDVKLYHPQ